MHVARFLALRAARLRSGQLVAAGSQASALSSAASTAALQAARPLQDGLFLALDSSLPASSSSAPRAFALAATASADGIGDGSTPSGGIGDGSATFGGGRSEQARSLLSPLFAQHDSLLLGRDAAGGRAAEAALAAPWPRRLTSEASGGASALLGGWPSRLAELRRLAALHRPETQQQLSASGGSADDGAGSGSEVVWPPLLTSRSLAARNTVLGGRWPSLRAAAAPYRFGVRQFSSDSGAAASSDAGNGDARRAPSSAGDGRSRERPFLVKLGGGLDSMIRLPRDKLLQMDRMAFVDHLATSSSFRVDFEGVSHSKCRVFLLPKVAGKLPTAEEEAGAMELVGTMTFGELVAQVDPSSSAIFARVLAPQARHAAAAIGEDKRVRREVKERGHALMLCCPHSHTALLIIVPPNPSACSPTALHLRQRAGTSEWRVDCL